MRSLKKSKRNKECEQDLVGKGEQAIAEVLEKYGHLTIKELSEILEEYKIYEGTFDFQNNSWEEDLYLTRQPLLEKISQKE